MNAVKAAGKVISPVVAIGDELILARLDVEEKFHLVLAVNAEALGHDCHSSAALKCRRPTTTKISVPLNSAPAHRPITSLMLSTHKTFLINSFFWRE